MPLVGGPGPADDDARLVERALDGDSWAEEALYRRHVRDVMNVAARVLGRSADAEDVVQEAFLVAFSRMGELRDPTVFGGWLCRIALNMVRGKLRRRRFLRTLGLDRGQDDATLAQLSANTASPELLADLAHVDAILRRLPAEPRMAWMLRHVEGWSLAEVAEALDCSLATAKRRIAHARRRIDLHLEPSSRDIGGAS